VRERLNRAVSKAFFNGSETERLDGRKTAKYFDLRSAPASCARWGSSFLVASSGQRWTSWVAQVGTVTAHHTWELVGVKPARTRALLPVVGVEISTLSSEQQDALHRVGLWTSPPRCPSVPQAMRCGPRFTWPAAERHSAVVPQAVRLECFSCD